MTPIREILNRVPLHTVRNPLGTHMQQFQLYQSRQYWVCLMITSQKSPKYQNFTFFPFFPKIYPPSTKKEIGFLYTLVGSHMQNFNLIRPGRVDLAWLQAKYQICPFCPKMTSHQQKWIRVPAIINIRKLTCTKFQLYRSRHVLNKRQAWLRAKNPQNFTFFAKKTLHRQKKEIGFLYTLVGSHMYADFQLDLSKQSGLSLT